MGFLEDPHLGSSKGKSNLYNLLYKYYQVIGDTFWKLSSAGSVKYLNVVLLNTAAHPLQGKLDGGHLCFTVDNDVPGHVIFPIWNVWKMSEMVDWKFAVYGLSVTFAMLWLDKIFLWVVKFWSMNMAKVINQMVSCKYHFLCCVHMSHQTLWPWNGSWIVHARSAILYCKLKQYYIQLDAPTWLSWREQSAVHRLWIPMNRDKSCSYGLLSFL